MNEISSIGFKIKKLRELKNYTQEYMAEKLNISQSTYARFEKDDSDVTISKLQQIAEVLEVTLNDILDFNSQYIFNNYSKTKNGFNINHSSELEKELFEKHINHLTKENEYLRGMLEKVLAK
ncbi:MAG: hypothetical protein RLZZ175_3116 [Bacteroidota bacterium]|jgi:transcriptional regulator with XRE-family HTH domain